ncbi:MAG: hypothetical protein JWN14_1510 [Chthonomonadales bacterium]|nr:hypothetical protein [Chthonomonadales bacterium]
MPLSPDLLNQDCVTRIMRCALSCPDATLVSWQCEPIAYAAVGMDSRGLFRVRGTALTTGQVENWEVILKVFRPLENGSTTLPTSAHYWKREALAYTSDLLASLPEAVRIPRCYEVEEQEDGSLWLWLEKVETQLAPPWPLSRFRLAATHLGLWNAPYLTGRPLPQHAWLSKGMTHIWAEENAYTIPLIAQTDAWESVALRLAFPYPVRERLLKLWSEREAYYHALDALPQTLCHHDAGHRNLFAVRDHLGEEQTCLIDWELVGYGAIGEELGNLFAPALINFEIEPAQAEALTAALLEGYIEGLRAVGWQGDAQSVRVGFMISALFRWGFAAAGWPVAIITDQSGGAERQTWEQWERPMEQVYQQWAGLTYYLLDLAEEIRSRGF